MADEKLMDHFNKKSKFVAPNLEVKNTDSSMGKSNKKSDLETLNRVIKSMEKTIFSLNPTTDEEREHFDHVTKQYGELLRQFAKLNHEQNELNNLHTTDKSM